MPGQYFELKSKVVGGATGSSNKLSAALSKEENGRNPLNLIEVLITSGSE